MPNIGVSDAQAWADHIKLNLTEIDSELEAAQAVGVIARVSQTYDVTTWVDEASTPKLIQKVIAMMYVGWMFQRTYSEDDDISTYGLLLLQNAEDILNGIVDGTLGLVEVPTDPTKDMSTPAFYPTDLSTASTATFDDPSLGPAKFSMGMIF